MRLSDLKRLRSDLHDLNCDWFSLRFVDERTRIHAIRDEKPETTLLDRTRGIMIEVVVDGHWAYAATPALELSIVKATAQKACKRARYLAHLKLVQFKPDQMRPWQQGRFSSPARESVATKASGSVCDLLVDVCKKLKTSDEIVRTEATAWLVESDSFIVSSSGTEIEQAFSFVAQDFAATAQKGSITQRRSPHGPLAEIRQGGLELLTLARDDDRINKVSEQARELVHAPNCPELLGDIVIMPDQMMLQIHESVGHPLELDRILGDERNYAGWSCIRTEDIGALQYGSELLNITVGPDIRHEAASYGFDDTGCASTKQFIIEKGRLVRALGGIESHARTGLGGTANARACSWNRPVIDRMPNLNLEPGSSSLEEMIAEVREGVLVEANRSWSIDDFRRKFQFGCEYAKYIKDGKIQHTVRDSGYRGISREFWKNLKRVGRPELVEVYGTPFCGKGEPNQSIRVGHASPPCLFNNVEIFGGVS